MKAQRKKMNHYKTAKSLINANISKHAVIFTVSLNQSYFVNRIHPQRKPCLDSISKSIFDPDSGLYKKIKLDWKFYPVIALKDAFGKFDKQYVHDVGYTLNNVTWLQAIEEALCEANERMGQVTQRFRMNCALVFCTANTHMTVEKIEEILSMDKDFHVWDEDREIRTSQEIAADELKIIERLEALEGAA